MSASRQSSVVSRQREIEETLSSPSPHRGEVRRGTIAAQLQEARRVLEPVAGANAALEARILAAHAWGMSPEALVREAEAPARDDAALQQFLHRRLQHEPIATMIGRKDFWRDTFAVTPDVLTPRADSETMLEILGRLRPRKDSPLRILDLGTGSGCLLLSALREYGQAAGVGVDRSQAALAVAQRNADALGMKERCDFIQSDWCSAVTGQFDVMLANPPYIPTAVIASLDAEVREYEPHGALDGGADGLDCYHAILGQVGPHLAPSAPLLFEVGMGQADAVAALGQEHGLRVVEIAPDLAGIPRIVALAGAA